MQQLEIEYFFPLTEQIPLGLDYEPSRLYAKELNRQRSMGYYQGSDGQVLMSGGTGFTTWAQPNTIAFKPEDDSVGYWELGTGFHFYNKKKPNWLHQKVVALLMGLKWKNK
jgi:hypothetical protein